MFVAVLVATGRGGSVILRVISLVAVFPDSSLATILIW